MPDTGMAVAGLLSKADFLEGAEELFYHVLSDVRLAPDLLAIGDADS